MKIWRHVARWIIKATRGQAHACALTPTHTPPYKHTHTQKYVIFFTFSLQQWFRERASVLRYTYIGCIVCFMAVDCILNYFRPFYGWRRKIEHAIEWTQDLAFSIRWFRWRGCKSVCIHNRSSCPVHAMKGGREWRRSGTHFSFDIERKVSCQLHALPTLPPGRETKAPIDSETGWAAAPVWTF